MICRKPGANLTHWRRPTAPWPSHGSTRRMRAMPRSQPPVNLRIRPWPISPNPGNRNSMYRIILFLVLIALAAWGAAWVADQSGEFALTWGGYRVETSLPVFALAIGIVVVAALLVWSIVHGLWKMPDRVRRKGRERRHARGRPGNPRGLLAIGPGDSPAPPLPADVRRRHASDDPLALLLRAQSAQLDGDRAGAQSAFRAMAERPDTRLLGLDEQSAVGIAEEA